MELMMFKEHRIHFWIAYAVLFIKDFQPIGCNFDFYVDSHQTKLLYGLDSKEIYFIRNGVINQNAVIFLNEDIPVHIKRLVFHWHASDSGVNTSYHLKLIHSPGPIMRPPILNISSNGFLPSKDTPFSIELPCTGRVSDHVDVLMKMTFISKLTMDNDPMELNFKRRKLCAKNSNYIIDDDSQSIQERSNDLVLPMQKITPFTSSAIAFISAATAILLLLFLLGLIYATRKKRHPNVTPSSLVHLDYLPHQNLPSDDDKDYSYPRTFSKYRTHAMKDGGFQGSLLTSCSKSLSLHFRSNSEHSRQLLQNYSSLSSASNPDPMASNTIYKYLPNRDESSSLSNMHSPNVPRSLVIEDGVLKLSGGGPSSSSYPPPPPPPPPSRIPNISSCSSSYSSSLSLNPQFHHASHESCHPKSIVSSSLTNSSNMDDFFPNGETLGIKTLSERDEEQSEVNKDEGREGDDVAYLPHLYSHLMPKNIRQVSQPET